MPTLLSATLCWKLFVFLFCFLCEETRKVFLLCEAISEDISCPEDATLSCQLIYIIFITKNSKQKLHWDSRVKVLYISYMCRCLVTIFVT